MADIKGKVEEAGHKIAEAATKVGHKISEGAEKAADWVKEKAHEVGHRADETAQKASHAVGSTTGSSTGSSNHISAVRERMEVIASCGKTIGKVDHIQGDNLKLTKNDSPDGQHHLIPASWIDHVDTHVHLNKNSKDAQSEWQSA